MIIRLIAMCFYKAIWGAENGDIGLENAYSWRINVEQSST